jgi:hypothetical protein
MGRAPKKEPPMGRRSSIPPVPFSKITKEVILEKGRPEKEGEARICQAASKWFGK